VITDVCAGVATILEPTQQADIDETWIEPYEWAPGRLYVYPTRQRFTGIESGPTARQDFELLAVYVVSGEAEEAKRQRSADITAALDAKASEYETAIRHNQRTELWDHLAANLDVRPPATVATRAVALRVSGYRLVN